MGSPQPSRSSSQHASRAARSEPVSTSTSDREGSRPITCRAVNASRSAIVCRTTERIASSRRIFQAFRKMPPIRVSLTGEQYHVTCGSAGEDQIGRVAEDGNREDKPPAPCDSALIRRIDIWNSLPSIGGEPWATNPQNRRSAKLARNNRQGTIDSAERQRPRSRRRHSPTRSECRELLITGLFATDGGSGPGSSLARGRPTIRTGPQGESA